MRPNFGCGIHDLVFEAIDSTTLQRIRSEVEEALRRYEARIDVLEVTVDEAATARRQAADRARVPRPQDQPDRQPRLPVLLPRGRSAMKPRHAPRLERRRTGDFERELRDARARVDSVLEPRRGEADFGRALLEDRRALQLRSRRAARPRGREDGARLSRLARRSGAAARPARMPVVFKLAETAREPVLASHPIKMQVDVGDATVTFETETDLQVIPGQLAAVVAVDPDDRRYYLPPPGLTSLDPLEPLPTAWKLKNFAAAKLEDASGRSGIGLRRRHARRDRRRNSFVSSRPRTIWSRSILRSRLVTASEPAPGSRKSRLSVRSMARGTCQEHILYIGDPELLNVEAKARVEVSRPRRRAAECDLGILGQERARRSARRRPALA